MEPDTIGYGGELKKETECIISAVSIRTKVKPNMSRMVGIHLIDLGRSSTGGYMATLRASGLMSVLVSLIVRYVAL